MVMSVYNDAEYLSESVESILSQEGVDFEFIIIDDGSTDGSGEMLDEYAAKDGRVRLIHQANVGLTRALIRGCDIALGQYIARQDGDDLSLAGRLAGLRKRIVSEQNLSFVSSWAKCVGPDGEQLRTVRRPSDSAEATRALLHERQGPPAHGSVMFKKEAYEAVGGYRDGFYYAQDSDLWLRLAEIGRVAYVPEVLYAYRSSPHSISSESREVQKEFGRLGRQCSELRLRGESDHEVLERAEALANRIRRGEGVTKSRFGKAVGHYLIGCDLARRGDRRALSYFGRAVMTHPFHWRAWCRLVLFSAKMLVTGTADDS